MHRCNIGFLHFLHAKRNAARLIIKSDNILIAENHFGDVIPNFYKDKMSACAVIMRQKIPNISMYKIEINRFGTVFGRQLLCPRR